MVCPHCRYNEDKRIPAAGGSMLKLPVKMEGKGEYEHTLVRANLYACPVCKKTFIGEIDYV